MNKKKRIVSVLIAGCIWWALFYPDLYLVKDDCLVVECENCTEYDTKDDLIKQICEAKPGTLVLKSRLFQWIRAKEK